MRCRLLLVICEGQGAGLLCLCAGACFLCAGHLNLRDNNIYVLYCNGACFLCAGPLNLRDNNIYVLYCNAMFETLNCQW